MVYYFVVVVVVVDYVFKFDLMFGNTFIVSSILIATCLSLPSRTLSTVITFDAGEAWGRFGSESGV